MFQFYVNCDLDWKGHDDSLVTGDIKYFWPQNIFGLSWRNLEDYTHWDAVIFDDYTDDPDKLFLTEIFFTTTESNGEEFVLGLFYPSHPHSSRHISDVTCFILHKHEKFYTVPSAQWSMPWARECSVLVSLITV